MRTVETLTAIATIALGIGGAAVEAATLDTTHPRGLPEAARDAPLYQSSGEGHLAAARRQYYEGLWRLRAAGVMSEEEAARAVDPAFGQSLPD
jgi:hypothetical protein